ncbi:MAG TPA: class I SAM-dependent methyltransferase [Terriglobales bacterium]|nr:class I SAM-dependent methyltransferase [Terriglobales bacterium]
MKPVVISAGGSASQCQQPRGWLGRLMLWNMNARHSGVTDWGLSHVTVNERDTILDIGCGGGRTLSKLASAARQGKVYGIDHSEASVAASKKTNANGIKTGQIEVRLGSVSELPFPDNMFDLVTAVETHFWWSNLPHDMRETFRVVKTGGRFIAIAEIYKGANTRVAKMAEQYASRTDMTLLSVDEHRELLVNAGYSDVQVSEERDKGWICAVGKKV